MQHDPLYLTPPGADTPPQPAANPVSDSVLLERAAAGEKQALTELFTRHSPRLYTLALRILSDPVEAVAVVKAVSHAVRYETRFFSPSQYPVHRWLSDMARQIALDHLRARTATHAA